MSDNMKTFLDAVQKSTEHKNRLEEIVSITNREEGLKELFAFSKIVGVELSAQDFEPELSEAQLENVAGGRTIVLWDEILRHNLGMPPSQSADMPPEKNYY